MNFRIAVVASAILLGILCPARLPAQATNPPYIAEMPSVDAVLKAMQAGDPDETAARQIQAFLGERASQQEAENRRMSHSLRMGM